MAIPESPITPMMFSALSAEVAKLALSSRMSAAATLTAAAVGASKTKFSIAQILEIHRDFYFSLFPEHGSSAYKEWSATKTARLATVRD